MPVLPVGHVLGVGVNKQPGRVRRHRLRRESGNHLGASRMKVVKNSLERIAQTLPDLSHEELLVVEQCLDIASNSGVLGIQYPYS